MVISGGGGLFISSGIEIFSNSGCGDLVAWFSLSMNLWQKPLKG
jgi:hypothetical protein